jgi:ribonuclease III
MKEFLDKNQIDYKNIDLYEQAAVHRSFINENPRFPFGHNERLEFLGDAVLELIVTDFLYAKYPHSAEGDMTSFRSALVNANTLSEISLALNLNKFLKLSKGEAKETEITRARMSILADTYESLLGAMYLDLGYDACRKWVTKTLLINTEEIVRKGSYKDSKSQVQEKSQEKLQITPTYKIIDESGPDHDKLFIVGIYFDEKEISRGEGKSKQLGEVDAAKNAIIKMGWDK